MTSARICFTRMPQKCTAVGKQLFWRSIDLGGDRRVVDVSLSVFALTGGPGPKVKVAILTSCQDDADIVGWATLGSFATVDAAFGADQTLHQVFVGALRYVRFEVVSLEVGASCYFTIDGEARTHE